MPNTSLSPLKSAVVLLLVLTGCAASCKRDGSQTVAVSPASAAAVKVQFDILRDSVDLKWRRMIENDDQKITVARLLLRELKGKPGIDATQLPGLSRAVGQLPTRRYTQQSMAASDLIDSYDTAQDSLLKALYPVAAPHDQAPTAEARNFVEGIQQLDSRVVNDRVEYDRAAQQYNAYLRLHQPELQTLGSPYAEAKPLPLFTIGAK